jgi:hypothetical protein
MKYVKIVDSEHALASGGIWPLTARGRVYAPCRCCNQWDSYLIVTEQIKKTYRSRPSECSIIYGGRRKDGYRFFAERKGRSVLIHAGCRHFTLDKAQEHWTEKGGTLGKWSLAAVARLKKQARHLGWLSKILH